MKTKEFNNNLAKVTELNNKIQDLAKQRDDLLFKTTSLFSKGQTVTYLDKNNAQAIGKVLYNVGQKSLTVVTPGNEKINVALDKLVIE